MLKQDFATNSTVMTKYGGAFTFGWEFESLTLNILKWYQPKTLQDWPEDLAAQMALCSLIYRWVTHRRN